MPASVLAIIDAVTDGMPPLDRQTWENRVLEALGEGADLEKIWMQWMLWSLRDPRAGLLQLNVDTLAHPTLELLERFYMRMLVGERASEKDIARIESVVALMEQDAAIWSAAQRCDFWEDGISIATRAFWDARDGASDRLGIAARAAARCRQSPNFAKWRSESLLDLVAHAPLGRVF